MCDPLRSLLRFPTVLGSEWTPWQGVQGHVLSIFPKGGRGIEGAWTPEHFIPLIKNAWVLFLINVFMFVF